MIQIMPLKERGVYTAFMKPTVMLLSLLCALLVPVSAPAACNVCHSKDPKMKRMHSALEYKNCFDCHGPSAKPTDRDKRSEDLRCMPCHKV